MLNRIVICLVALTLFIGGSAGAWAQERLALIVGNSKYQTLPTLDNPFWDAKAISSLLKSAGFDVTLALDLGRMNMQRAVREFSDKVAGKGADSVALVYFAGHGLQIDGQNFLLPIDFEAELPRHATGRT